jgi:hypothetical protein
MIARLVDYLSTLLAEAFCALIFWGVREIGDGIADLGGDD